MLKKRGIDRVRPLGGGLDAWIAAGRPVEALEEALEGALEETRAGAREGAG